MNRSSAEIQAELEAHRAERKRLDTEVSATWEAMCAAKNARAAFVDREHDLREELDEATYAERIAGKNAASAKRTLFVVRLAEHLRGKSDIATVKETNYYGRLSIEQPEILVTFMDGTVILVEFWLWGPEFAPSDPMAEVGVEGQDGIKPYFGRARALQERFPDVRKVRSVLVTDSRVSSLTANVARTNKLFVLDSVKDDPAGVAADLRSLIYSSL